MVVPARMKGQGRMTRVPKSLRPRIWGPLSVVLLLSAGAHAAFFAVARHAYPATLVRSPVDNLYTCQYEWSHGFYEPAVHSPAAEPHHPRWPSAVPAVGARPDDERVRIAHSIHAVFDRHQADLDSCAVRFGDRRRLRTSYQVHVEVKYGHLKPNRLSIKTAEPKLRRCLRKSIRRWEDWPMDPERIVVDISRRLRRTR